MQRNTDFTLRDMIFLLKKRVVMIFTVTAATVLLSLIYSFYLVQPLYRCTTTLIVCVEQSGSSSISTSAQIADTFGYILKNQALVDKVIAKLEIDTDAETLADNIDFSEIESTGIYKLSVAADSDFLAGAVTDAFMQYVPEEISRSLKPGSIEVVTLSKDTKQISPNTLNNTVAGFFIGFSLSCVLSLLLELTSNRFTTNEDIKNRLDYPVIGVIPRFSPSIQIPSKSGENAPFAEAFNALQTVLHYTAQNRTVKTLMILSPLPGDGKTSVCLNLAAAMQSNGRKILIVDADFRSPGISGALFPSEPDQKGLSAVLTGSTALDASILSFSGVDVLPSGPTPERPGEALQSYAMADFLEEAAHSYDVIVFDVPAMTKYSDAATLLPLMDGVLFVIRHNYTTFEAAVFTKERIELLNAPVIGCVMNAFDVRITNKIYTYDPPDSRQRKNFSQTLFEAYRFVRAYLKTKLPKRT